MHLGFMADWAPDGNRGRGSWGATRVSYSRRWMNSIIWIPKPSWPQSVGSVMPRLIVCSRRNALQERAVSVVAA